jgi:hypothetical protein
MDPRAGLDNVEKKEFLTLPGLELRPFGRSARSQSLYRLRYLGSSLDIRTKFYENWFRYSEVIKGIFFIWFVRLLAVRPLLAYCASLG